jgi:hypothetical protein
MICQKQPVKPALIAPVLGVLVLAVMCLYTLQARAAEGGAYMTGRALSLLCVSNKGEDQFSCQSYIAGVIDYHHLVRSMGAGPAVDFCVPDTLKMAQIKNIVTMYIRQHTEHQDFIAAPAVAMALFNAYPCNRPKAKTRGHR